MNLEPPGKKQRRQDILRGVYEENLRIGTKAPSPRRRMLPRPSPRNGRLLAALAVLLVLVGGFQVIREIQAQQRAERAAEDAAARMAREFESEAALQNVPSGAIANVFGLQVRRLVLDPGHGGEDPGASGPTGLAEKDVTLDVARRLQRRLERDYGFEVLLTREGDEKVSLRRRVAFANESGADLFVSIHVNALPVDTVTSVETYYFGLQTDEKTLRLASRENQDSDLTIADFRNTLEEFGDTMKFQESKDLAVSIQTMLVRNMRRENEALSDWGVRRGPFVVLFGVEVPSVLAEVAVISNADDEARLQQPDYREQIAAALEAGILTYLHPDASLSTTEASEHGSQTHQ